MAWGVKTNATQLTNITDTEVFFNTKPSMAVGDTVLVQVKVTFPENGVDWLRVRFYSTLDASNECWDTSPFIEAILTPNESVNSWVVKDKYKFRVSVIREGATDTITAADLSYRLGTSIL